MLAREIAERAGRMLFERYEQVEQIDHKSAKDVVTEVDHLSEALILDAIREAGSRTTACLAEDPGRSRGAGPPSVWIVDPLDGTVNYANGIPVFCVSIGLVVGGPRSAPSATPMRGETFAALPADGPAQWPADPRPRQAAPLGLRRLARPRRAGDHDAGPALRRAVRVAQHGSAALALAYVANGRFDAFVQQGGLSAWDVAAAGLIAERGGARVTRRRRRPLVRCLAGPASSA